MSKKTMKDYITDIKPIRKKNTSIVFPKKTDTKKSRINNPKKQFLQNIQTGLNCIKSTEHLSSTTQLTRKIKRNFVIEKTIDLHGLTQNKALDAVANFFANCQENGIKKVLVITGGSSSRQSIIRPLFITWISQYFSKYVASYSTSKPTDGGEGAFYVALKSKKIFV